MRAAGGVWEEIAQDALGRAPDQTVVEQRYRLFRMNQANFLEVVRRAPMESTVAARLSEVVLELPLPDGTLSRFRIEESPILEADLQAQFPEIQTFHGQGIDDPTATTRFDWTPAGFHAIVFTTQGTVYVDPHTRGDLSNYVSYRKKDYRRKGGEPFRCTVHRPPATGDGAEAPVVAGGTLDAPLDAPFGTTRRNYRTAVAATGEYTAFHGGTVPLALSAITTTVNRVSGIYEREVAVRLTLVGSQSSIIYTNGLTDPYTNDDGFAMLTQNQSNLDTVIGSANYDLGHVFSTGGGGIAGLGVVCLAGGKGQGVTGSPAPVGDPFDVDYVAHEMGHQFAGNHTFNGTTGACGGGNRNASTAFEPGSGSTIQAYAGICGAENLQPNSDDYFHSGSLAEIRAFINGGSGDACDAPTATGNTPPTVNAGADFTIPRSTPFTLTASASDGNGDTITYAWEEMDLGTAGPPNTDNGSRPIFRSFDPTTSPSRTFPRLSDVLNNASTFGESLPTTTRTMTFRATVRDNRAGGGGTNWDEMLLNVRSDSGPFLVTAPDTAVSWTGLGTQTVTWNVASTNLAPVSTANVKISLSTDGGNTFPTVILASTANDGSESITVPNVTTTTARIKVEAVGNVYFDLSNVNFSITASVTPVIEVTPTSVSFGSVNVGSTSDRTVTVKNIGGGTLTGTGSVTGTGFSLVGSGAYSLTNNQTADLTVRFAPTGAGPASGSLTLTGGGGATVPLSGTGVATGPTLTVVGSTTVNPGASVQVTVANGPANTRDWVALHTSASADTSYLDWKYLNGTKTAPITGLAGATLTFTMPLTPGTYNFRFFQNNTFTKLATSATVTVTAPSTPTLTPSTTTATPGQVIQVTVANGPGNTTDWVGMHATAGADTALLDWKYLSGTRTPPGTGVTGATLTFTLPTAPGTYNFRFFQNNTYNKLATSATVTVAAGTTPTLTLSSPTATPGQTIQVTLANGPGNPTDWIGLNMSSAADMPVLDWKYLNGTRTAPVTGLTGATVAFTAPSTPGTYNFRFFQNNTYTKLATSATLTVAAGSTPTVNVSTTTAAPGQVIQVTIASGPGNARDWVGMHASAAADSVYLDWKYLNGTRTPPVTGLTGATINFTVPMTPGTYNFRFFQNNTFTKLATSPTVTVQ